MCKNQENYKKWSNIFCVLLLIGSLLLSGCTAPSGEQGQTQPSETTNTTEDPGTMQADETEPDASDDPSLVIFRQAMVETPQLFAAAFFGYAPQTSDQGADPFAVMREAAPQLCEDLPFLLSIDRERILGVEGQLFCIVPADENAAVAVNRGIWNEETGAYECTEVIYRSDSGRPILVMCNSSGWELDTEIVITDSNGNVAVWYPHMDSSYCVAPLRNENGESLIFDFTSYEELPTPGWNQGIDSSGLAGSWELAWTEVEGDRNEAAPGVCTIEITPDGTGFFRITYLDRDFPDWNVSDRELIVTPGELYPGCDNDQWIAEVAEASGDTVHFALTILENGSLLMQHSWEMDGMPMVSYGWFRRIS